MPIKIDLPIIQCGFQGWVAVRYQYIIQFLHLMGTTVFDVLLVSILGKVYQEFPRVYAFRGRDAPPHRADSKSVASILASAVSMS